MLTSKKNKKSAPQTDTKKQAAANPPGITAKGNALRKVTLLALLAMLVPVALGFGYLILVREPAMQEQQIDRVASSFASQQATNMHRLFTRIKDRIKSAARSPLAL
ncbi:MAG: phosphomannomutase/phosphoglucomutase, partial [Gammaproteobacteria bacterium]|nr:phosphomannomutase/phosphoglucomutase [Gammaproteobacteria bacterium]